MKWNMFKVNKKREIIGALVVNFIVKFGFFIVTLKHISHLALVFLLLTLNKQLLAGSLYIQFVTCLWKNWQNTKAWRKLANLPDCKLKCFPHKYNPSPNIGQSQLSLACAYICAQGVLTRFCGNWLWEALKKQSV